MFFDGRTGMGYHGSRQQDRRGGGPGPAEEGRAPAPLFQGDGNAA